jgi:hypothetical protein
MAIARVVCVLLFVVFPALAIAGEPGQYVDPTYGFSLSVPKFEKSTAERSTTVLVVAGPATEQFGPSINVQVEPASGTLDEFAEATRQQILGGGYELRATSRPALGSHPGVLWHYAGAHSGRPLEHLTVAVSSEGRIYSATATATPNQFQALREVLEASLLSLRPPGQE